MISHKCMAFLLLLISLSLAFDATQYFYPTEEDVNVYYTNFSLNGYDYAIVTFNGQDTFLLKDDVPVSNEQEIKDTISQYYLEQFYPTDEELDTVRGLIDSYNESRNNGQKFKGKEEYVCREVLFIDGRVKYGKDPIYCRNEGDEEFCEYSAMLMYQFLSSVAEVPPVGSPQDLLEPIETFGFASYGTDDILNEIVGKLDAAETDSTKMYDALDTAGGSIEDLEGYMDDMEDSLFTWTDQRACDSQHWCLCPDIDLDENALEDLQDEVEVLLEKMGPYGNYETVASNIYTNSISRIDYSETESSATEYLNAFKALNQSGADALALGEEATTHVSNATLEQKYDDLRYLQASIPDNIEARDFTTMEEDLASYEGLLGEVSDGASVLIDQYNKTKEAKNAANSLVIILETKDLDPMSMESLELLRNSSGDLDARFRDGLTLAQLADLEVEYNELVDRGQDLLKTESDMPSTRVLLLFRGFARNVNEGIANVAEDSEVIAPKEISDNKLLTLGFFSTLLFLSLGSLVVLTFLYIIATTKFVIPQTGKILASAFISIFVLLLGFSIFTYLFLNKTSSEATLTEFLTEFDTKSSAAIVVDLQDASYADAQAMTECAGSLSDTFEQQNKSWVIYRHSTSSCTMVDAQGKETSLSVAECEEKIDTEESSFELAYSPSNEPPKFSIIYENKAEINANLDYYESCPLASLIS